MKYRIRRDDRNLATFAGFGSSGNPMMLLSAAVSVFLSTSVGAHAPTQSYASDLAFLKQYVPVVELRLGASRLVVVPKWQARVMTSALGKNEGGFGWINYDFIKTKTLVPHMNVFGGEDRIWLGPEGGQFSLFFKKDSKFDLANWQTPPFMDTDPFQVVSKTASSIRCRHFGTLTNYSGTKFHVEVTRTVRLLSARAAAKDLHVQVGKGVNLVGYESENHLRNMGKVPWTEKSGLLSLWVLGQLHHSPTTTVAIPYTPGPVDELGVVANDTYFGKVPADRLIIGPKTIYFKADGQYRSKIGLNPRRAHDVLGSWDPGSGVLTIVQYNKPAGVTRYVNSMWEIQQHPFAGDCLNSYNDGPPAPGAKPLGPFYEVESSSPAAELASGQTITHIHRTFHFSGNRAGIEAIAHKVLGVRLKDIEDAFGSK
jgi:hypothetical protein